MAFKFGSSSVPSAGEPHPSLTIVSSFNCEEDQYSRGKRRLLQPKGKLNLLSAEKQVLFSNPPEVGMAPGQARSGSSASAFGFSADFSSFAAQVADSLRNMKLSQDETAAPGNKMPQATEDMGSKSSASPAQKNDIATPPDTGSSQHEDSSEREETQEEEYSTEDASDDGESYSGENGALANHEAAVMNTHLRLLERRADLDELEEVKTTPIFTEAVRRYARSVAPASSKEPFTQYGLIAGDASDAGESASDPRIFYNVAAPSSVFICGSQGSGKSHTLSCLLENCLINSPANTLPRPLTGIVFHYDTFISDTGGSPCEVAWLSSNPDLQVRVLCPPTNIGTMKRIYKQFPNIKVRELRLSQTDLNTKRMLDLMAVTTSGGAMPLYLHVANRILRDMRILQQQTGSGFNYADFKLRLEEEQLTKEQLAPLKQRLDTLESFMVEDHAKAYDMFARERRGISSKKSKATKSKGTDWTPSSGQLTIVDLSCPCVTADMACSLFNICLSLFLEQDSQAVGRVVALDEAHKYMTESSDCQALTESLLATIRLQRHLGARVFISTQEPTISPKLLDLCSVTIVHRFTSPDWLKALQRHLAGVSSASRLLDQAERLHTHKADDVNVGDVDGLQALSLGSDEVALELFSRIVGLRTGEALLFAPSAIIAVRRGAAQKTQRVAGASGVRRLAHGVLRVRIRSRLTTDGGRSIMAA